MLQTEASLICPLEEVTVHADNKVLIEVDANSLQVVGDPHGTMVQQVRPNPIYLLKFMILLIKLLNWQPSHQKAEREVAQRVTKKLENFGQF
jgi:hypothetical protein